MYIGIDPGKTGAIAFLDEKGNYVNILDYDADNVARALFDYKASVKYAYLERVHSMPGQGVSSTFSFGENFGWWNGVLRAFQIPYDTIPPQSWMKRFSLHKSSLNDKPSLAFARKKFPDAPLNLKKHHNRADSLLIALTCWEDKHVLF